MLNQERRDLKGAAQDTRKQWEHIRDLEQRVTALEAQATNAGKQPGENTKKRGARAARKEG